MNKNLLYLFLFVLTGCSEGEKKSPNVFFAGEIVNPTNKYVVLYKDDVVIDSAELDANNRFSFNLSSITEGLHHFSHSPESQYIYLEKSDSLMVRLNVMDFDESLVFSGKGEEINNFLIELFLANEQESPLITSYFSLEPKDFQRNIDSLKKEKLKELDALGKEALLSSKAVEIANANINYTYNTFKEKYVFEHQHKTGKNAVDKLPKGFYTYRNQISYNDTNLNYLRSYYNFMREHVNNVSYMSCKDNCDIEKYEVYNRLHFNKHRLRLIDSMVQQKNLKDNLSRYVAIDYLIKVHDDERNGMFMNEFKLRYADHSHIDEINALYNGIRNLQPNKQVPDLMVQGIDTKNISLQYIAEEKKNVVFYFWSGARKRHYKDMMAQVLKLKDLHPQYTYVGINYNTEEKQWKGILETHNLDQTLQFRSLDFDELRNILVLNFENKAIILKDGLISNAFTNMYALNSF